ncbi:hypothetical protein [Stenotrophomonas sp. YIM B06876]|uniref:hypothetical protein n=1 Tax=Stenotrophomonas sp. YIM B06876 TaxID=3060211 RepID=UPI00273A0993|nr:hypothetical protein [Stenotrophomonas sp. YIM B06876]
MEFTVRLASAQIDLPAIETGLQELDPAGLVDVAGSGTTLRVCANVRQSELLMILGNAGCAATLAQIERLPSVCCGGCGG